MLILGQGGTGKSKLRAGLSCNVPKDNDWLDRSSKVSVERHHSNMKGKEFLIVDEVSMETKETAYCLSEIIRKSRAMKEKGRTHEPFGSMHVIKCGDFHHFPPVGNDMSALSWTDPTRTVNEPNLAGKFFYNLTRL